MDNQPNPQNPGERPAGPWPENLPTPSGFEAVPRPEAAPAPPPPPPGQPLTRDDVAAVIAAMPGPNGPPSAVSGGAPVPLTAADVDLIEPEWVNKAEEVVMRTAGNPHAEEEAVERLQEQYLKQRYGYNVGHPNDGSAGVEGQ